MAKRVRRKKSVIVRLIVFGVCVYMIATLSSLWAELSEGRKELALLEQQKQALELRNDELRLLLEEGSHEEIIERAAREKLSYVFPNEEIYKEDKLGN